MNANFFEAKLSEALHLSKDPKRIKSIGESSLVFTQLMKNFPSIGSKIDWGHVPGSIQRSEDKEHLHLQRFISFFDEVVERFRLTGDVVYVGDSATDFALKGSIECMREALPEVLTIPQHHYFISPSFSWCMCFTMEGDMGFGIAPPLANIH